MGIAANIINKITNWFRGSPTKGMSEEDFAEWLGIGYRNKSELREVTYYTCMKILSETTLNSIMFLLIPVPKPTAYLLHETPLFCRPLQNISFLSHSSSYVLATPPILAIFYFCRFPAFFTLSQVDRNHYIFIISSFLLA